ncbi:MAG: hypothetical protein ACK5OX_13215 [Desertimonas sp.]
MIVDTITGGLLTSLVFTIVLLIMLRLSPQALLPELTDGRERAPSTPTSAIGFALVTAAVMGGTLATTRWVAASHDLGVVERFFVAWSVIAMVNLVDFVVIDLVIYTWIYPSFMQLPGYPPKHDATFHAIGAAKGTAVIGIPTALIVTAITASV